MAAHKCQLWLQSDFYYDGTIKLVARRGICITLLKRYV